MIAPRAVTTALLAAVFSIPASYTPIVDVAAPIVVQAQVQPQTRLSLTADCIMLGEFDNVDEGMTRDHVQDDIFDGYNGIFITITAEGWSLRAYDACDGEHEAYVFYGSGELHKVKDKNWHIK